MLNLLGEPVVLEDGRAVPLALRPKALALLAYLAITARSAARRDLAGLLFPSAEDPLATLRWHVAHVRSRAPRSITDRLTITTGTMALTIATDVAAFRLGAAHIQEHPDAATALSVLEQYRGDLLAGLAVSASAEFDTWLYVERERLQRDFRQAVAAFARWALAHGNAAEAVRPLARLASLDPYFEDGHVLLIEAYDAMGQRDLASAAYDRYQRIVRTELVAEPQPAVVRRFESDPPSGRTLPRDELVPLRQVTLHFVEWPGGELPIVALHGSGGLGYGMDALAERLSPAHRVVAPDLRGHGLSDKPPSGYYLEDHVSDVIQLIEALDLRRPVLMGHSAGGTIAAFVAAQIPAGGLILLEAMIGDRAFSENAAAQSAPLADGFETSVGGFREYLDAWRAKRQPWSEEAERLLDRWVRYALAPQPDGRYRRRGFRAAVEAEWASIVAADSLGALGRVSCPVLIVQALQPWWGGRPYFTNEIVAAQRQAAPAAELFVASRSNHSTLIRDPEPEMIEAMGRFLERCHHTLATPRQPGRVSAR